VTASTDQQPVAGQTGQPAQQGQQGRTTTRGSRVVRRRPVPIGTVSIGAVAATGTAVTAAATVLSPVVAVVVVAGAAVVPLAAVIHRTRRHRASRRARNPFGRGGGGGGLGGGLGGVFGRLGGRGRRAGGGSLGRGTGGTGGTRGAGSHRAGRAAGRAASRGAASGGAGRGAGRASAGGASTGRSPGRGAGRGAGRGSGSGGPRSSGRLGLGSIGSVGKPLWTATRAAGRAAGRGAGAAARGTANAARAAHAGTKTQGGYGAAARGAWNAAGAGRPRTFTGWMGRVVVGGMGACGAVASRLLGRFGRKAWTLLRGLYQVAPQQGAAQFTPPPASRFTPEPVAQPHPVPPPRRAMPVPNGGGAFPAAPVSAPTGGSMRFTPVDIAVDLEGACRKWRPGKDPGSLGVFQDALPAIANMVTFSAAAYWWVMSNSAEDLRNTLNIQFVHTTAKVYELLFKASQLAQALPGEFPGLHADYVQRRATQNSQTSNVGAGTVAG
jgi:hypothetical protein